MRRSLRFIGWSCGGVVVILAALLAARLSLNFMHSPTLGAESLRLLAASAPGSVRDAARATATDIADHANARGPEYASIAWVAVVDTATRRDTVVLHLFRAEDATLLRRMRVAGPTVGGVALYSVVDRRLVSVAIGVQ
jgi:hypothetical protein